MFADADFQEPKYFCEHAIRALQILFSTQINIRRLLTSF